MLNLWIHASSCDMKLNFFEWAILDDDTLGWRLDLRMTGKGLSLSHPICFHFWAPARFMIFSKQDFDSSSGSFGRKRIYEWRNRPYGLLILENANNCITMCVGPFWWKIFFSSKNWCDIMTIYFYSTNFHQMPMCGIIKNFILFRQIEALDVSYTFHGNCVNDSL